MSSSQLVLKSRKYIRFRRSVSHLSSCARNKRAFYSPGGMFRSRTKYSQSTSKIRRAINVVAIMKSIVHEILIDIDTQCTAAAKYMTLKQMPHQHHDVADMCTISGTCQHQHSSIFNVSESIIWHEPCMVELWARLTGITKITL